MKPEAFIDPNLTPQDRLVLQNLLQDIGELKEPTEKPSTARQNVPSCFSLPGGERVESNKDLTSTVPILTYPLN